MNKSFAFMLVSALGFSGVACQNNVESDARNERAYNFVTSRVEDVVDEIAATDEQRARINAIKDKLFDDMSAMRGDSMKARKEALAEWRKETPDKQRMHELVDQRMDAWRAAAHEVVEQAVEVHGVLTPSQREQIAALVEERMARHEH